MASPVEPELGTAQPQLVSVISFPSIFTLNFLPSTAIFSVVLFCEDARHMTRLFTLFTASLLLLILSVNNFYVYSEFFQYQHISITCSDTVSARFMSCSSPFSSPFSSLPVCWLESPFS